jgi:endonuclease YncB( thermonuclease family)
MRSIVQWVRRHVGMTALAVAMVLVLAHPPASLLCAQTAPPGGAPPAGTGSIELEGYVRAIQGDTLDARTVRGRVAIGIVGIQAPRGKTPCAQEATAFVQALVASGARVDEEPGLVFDARSRRMYHVNTLDGQSVAEEVVAAGLARANGQGSTRERLAALEAEAREAKRGCLWKGGGTQ